MYIDKLDDIVNEYNSTYHRTIKMKSAGVKDNTCIKFSKEVNDKDPKFKIGFHVRISKCKNIFAEGYTPNWSEEIFVISKIKNTVKITDIENKCITTADYKKFTKNIVDNSIKSKNLVNKSDINGFIKMLN